MRTCEIACIATLLVGGGAQEESRDATIEQELAALIEKTNALGTFHAVYDMQSTAEGKPESISMEIVYEAPGTGRLRAKGPEGEQDFWIVGDRVVVRGDGAWRQAEMPGPTEAGRRLDELFPRAKASLEPGLFVQLSLKRNGELAFQLSLGRSVWERLAVLEWLQAMRRDLAAVGIEDESLVWTGEGWRVLVSHSTGFIQAVDAKSTKGELHVRLLSLRVDDPLPESLVTLPREAEEAEPDPDLGRAFAALRDPDVVRRLAYRRVSGLLDSGEIEWDERCRSDWQSLLEAIHGEALPQRKSKWLDEVRVWIEQGFESMRGQLDTDDSNEVRARLREQAASARALLETKLDASENKYLESLSSPGDEEWNERLLEEETEAVRKAYDVVIRQPMLTFFDERITAMLGE
jgi:hypothetical protein